MSGTLKVILMGAHLGGDATNRFTPTGKQVISFSAASNRQYNSTNGEPAKETTWLHCTVWPVSDAQADFFLKNLIKGRKVSFEGRLVIDPQSGGPRIWERQDGSKGCSFEVIVNPVSLDISNNGIANGYATEEGSPAAEETIPF